MEFLQHRSVKFKPFWNFVKKSYVGIITFCFCIFFYTYLYANQFLSKEIVLGGDTQLLWSVHYLFYYSIRYFHELIWWDPTGINGWPIYYFLTAGGYNLLSPFSFLATLLFIFINLLFTDLDINKFIVFQDTLYYFGLSLIAVQLIARELISSRIALIFVAIAFTLGAMPFAGFRDSYILAPLPAALFYVWGLIQFNNKKTPLSFFISLFLTAIFLSSMCYGVALSSLYWTTLFTVFLIIAYPSLLTALWSNIKKIIQTKKGKIALALGIITSILGIIAAIYPVLLLGNDFVRIPGKMLDYGDKYAGWSYSNFFGASSSQLWNVLLVWVPFREIHDVIFKSDIWKSGMDHWYIGLATLPLIATALVLRGSKNRYILVLLLVTFMCAAIIPYTYNNLIFLNLMKKYTFFQNVRTMPGLLPRGGVTIFLILVAGIGLDALLNITTKIRKNRIFQQRSSVLLIILIGLMVIGAASITLGMLNLLSSTTEFQIKGIRHGFTHLGIYLGLFALLCTLMLFTTNRKSAKFLAFAVLLLTFTDLTISSSHYWKDGKIWYMNGGPHALPEPKSIGPISSEQQQWTRTYSGVFHHIFMDPFYGARKWLTFASRPKYAPMLENWNYATRQVTAYPYFRYFTNGRYVPFEDIYQADVVVPPEKGGSWFYLHDSKLMEGKPPVPAKIKATQTITQFTFNRLKVDVFSPTAGFMVFYDNNDRYWRAKVNGERVKIYPANFTFKAIKIPAGNSTVEWIYNPYPIKISWCLFYLSLFGFGYAIFWYFRTPKNTTNA